MIIYFPFHYIGRRFYPVIPKPVLVIVDMHDFDFSYIEKLENSNDTKTITHYYSDEQQRQIINFVGHAVFEYFIKNKDTLLQNAKTIVGAGNRITEYEN